MSDRLNSNYTSQIEVWEALVPTFRVINYLSKLPQFLVWVILCSVLQEGSSLGMVGILLDDHLKC